ncbi:MAG TPA: four helix bundle protein [Candidatus Polarisedimenticolia bacterium]|nr:four helix bundle protein [Candidatus Polarisedimenticolia bacterium]
MTRVGGLPDPAEFETSPVYKATLELTSFIYSLEDRFPVDEIPVIYRGLTAAAAALGACIAEGIGRDGVDAGGGLSERTRCEARGKLNELKHYFALAASRYLVDEGQSLTFTEITGKVRSMLSSQVERSEAGG